MNVLKITCVFERKSDGYCAKQKPKTLTSEEKNKLY